jgi:plasmid segregation protein ParM
VATLVAVDCGFGNVKAASLDTNTGRRKTVIFPSGVEADGPVQVSDFGGDDDTGIHDLYPVINGIRFRVNVNPDVAALRVARPAPVDDFQKSPQHLALAAAALRALDVNDIDVLVLGTPVHTWSSHRQYLKEVFTRECDFGLGRLEILRTLVVPQPFGSALFAQAQGEIQLGPLDASVFVDAGFYTLDCLTMQAMEVVPGRTFGIPVGMHTVCDRLAAMLGRDYAQSVTRLDRIDYALRTKQKLRIGTHDVDLDSYLPRLQPVVRDAVNSIKGRLGSHEDAKFVVTGGGASLFVAGIREAFPNNHVMELSDQLYGNVEGFLIAARAAYRTSQA